MDPYEFEKVMKSRPHLVILGAGASMAAIPYGDLNGRKTSVMSGFINKLGMRDLINSVHLKTKSDNLEDIYSELFERPDCEDVLISLEKSIYDYFKSFEIPHEPTIYDMLILSLREKDVIATFNWDPLLLQAYQRVSNFTDKLPRLLSLHGNVLIGICEEDKRAGIIDNLCSMCGKPYKKTKLLYPIKNKDYQSDPFIRSNWNAIQNYMKRAYVITIFGYSAPKTDSAAIELLKNSWGKIEDRNLEEIEIIDIQEEDKLRDTWKGFIHSHHYKVYNSFFDTLISKFPRRSCDAIYDMVMNVKFLDGNKGLKKDMDFHQLNEYFTELLVAEENNNVGFFSVD